MTITPTEATTPGTDWPSAMFAGLAVFVATVPAPTLDTPSEVLPNEVMPIATWHSLTIGVRTPWDDLTRATPGDPILDGYQPRTELGRRLLALRRAYIEGGGRLMTQKEVLEHVRRLRAD